MMKRTNLVQQVMDEYVNWGGPIITRAIARQDCIDKGYGARAIDMLVFGRQSVPTPADPAWHLAFHRHVQVMEGTVIA